jgi:hypothetical protein
MEEKVRDIIRLKRMKYIFIYRKIKIYSIIRMTFQEKQNERILRLLKKDAERRKYIRDYMKEYRAKKKEETGQGQKQYYTNDEIKIIQRRAYKLKTVLNDIRFLFLE